MSGINLSALPNYKFRRTKLAAQARVLSTQLLSIVQGLRVKAGTIGGEQEASFEQSFASLAYVYLKDKAPRLLDFMLGFQLVDRDDDKTKAVGIFGFKVGSQWLYSPVFFLNGQLKGHELLYLKGQDQFVPLKENWVNFVLSQRPHILGEPEQRNLSQLGVLQPNLYRLSSPPYSTKFGSVQVDLPKDWPSWMVEVAPCLGSWATDNPIRMEKYAGLDNRLSLQALCRDSLYWCKMAMDTCERYPVIGAYVEQFYGNNFFRDSLLHLRKTAMASEEGRVLRTPTDTEPPTRVLNLLDGPVPVKQAAGPAVEIHVNEDQVFTQNAPELTESERERLMRDGHLIKDHREGDEVSKKYNTQTLLELANPEATGLYEVLVKPHGFAKCLVISAPQTSEGRQDFSTLIRLEPKDWMNAHRSTIYAKPKLDNEVDSWNKWYEKLGKGSLEKGGVYVIVSREGQGTAPFRVEETLGDGRFKVSFKDYATRNRPKYMPQIAENDPDWDADYYFGSEMISLNEREGTSFKSMSNTLYVPKEHKIVRVEKTEADTDKNAPCCVGAESHSKDTPLRPGNLSDIQAEILQKSAQLKLYANSNEVSINNGQLMPKRAALFTLVRYHGFREKEAKELITETEKLAMRGKPGLFRIKYAQGYPGEVNGSNLVNQGPGAPAMPEPMYGADPSYGNVQQQYPQSDMMPVPELNSQNTDPNTYNPLPEAVPDPMAMQQAQQAGQMGQKEVFDTSLISGLIRTSRQDNMVNRYLGDLLKALDRLGRLLFVFYWHNDEFSDQYGKSDLPELEDSLRNTFESLGDLVLWLKEKDVGPMPGMNMGEPQLAEAAEGA